MSEYRALRFGHPGREAALHDPTLPLGLELSAGYFAMVEDLEAIRQDLFMLLTTRLGERVMRPDYGCDLYRVMFSPNDDTTAGLAIHYVRQAIARWEPRVEAVVVDATRSPEDAARLDIHLSYRVRRTRQRDHLSMALDLDSGVRILDREGGFVP